jgi:hypothetical protein
MLTCVTSILHYFSNNRLTDVAGLCLVYIYHRGACSICAHWWVLDVQVYGPSEFVKVYPSLPGTVGGKTKLLADCDVEWSISIVAGLGGRLQLSMGVRGIFYDPQNFVGAIHFPA